jgi:hypothetical protein
MYSTVGSTVSFYLAVKSRLLNNYLWRVMKGTGSPLDHRLIHSLSTFNDHSEKG